MKFKNDMDILQLNAYYNDLYLLEIKEIQQGKPIAICLCKKCNRYITFPIEKPKLKCKYCSSKSKELIQWQNKVRQEQENKFNELKEQYQYNLNQLEIEKEDEQKLKTENLKRKFQLNILKEQQKQGIKLTDKQKEYIKNSKPVKPEHGSSGEKDIAQLLIENNIDFKREVTFPDLIYEGTNGKLRFDFFVEDKYIIEFDGKQHFEEIKYFKSTDLKETQKRDEIKNTYCHHHGIPIIRIPYWHQKDLCIEDLLLETTTFEI